MSVLFGKRRRGAAVPSKAAAKDELAIVSAESPAEAAATAAIESSPNGAAGAQEGTAKQTQQAIDVAVAPSPLLSFLDLGLDAWLVRKCELVGIRTPTPVQAHCIPPILQGRDVLGCAQTGSGKTAAFALPILHVLGKDPYGPFAVVLTPTRELAFQISEQFAVFGTSLGVRSSVIVGGVDMLKQALELQERPHVIIATPGRLHDHLMGPNPPSLKLVKFVVLDEADRLLDASFAKDLGYILDKLPSSRQTLLFSATMTANLDRLDQLAMTNTYRFDATPSIKTVATLKQHYLFIPAAVKMTYLMYLISLFNPSDDEDADDARRPHKKSKAKGAALAAPTSKRPSTSMIVFVATCTMCELVREIAQELGTSCVALHSMMSQNRRLAALGKFKSGISRVLISTDVASRGLDIPEVDVVLNFDLPRDADDYIHRVGRTARAGRQGQSISLVTQHDIALVQHIEARIGKKMDNYEANAREDDVLKLLNDVGTATRIAKMRLKERGFDDKVQARRAKRQSQHPQASTTAQAPSKQKQPHVRSG